MAPFDGVLRTETELREIIRPPGKRAAQKQIDHLDANCRAYIAHAPFAIVATTNLDGTGDASPKGGPPGFVRVLDDQRRASLWDPDHWPDTAEMPTIACMLVRHADIPGDPDGTLTAAALEENYATTLWN